MMIQQELKVLEMKLTGSDITLYLDNKYLNDIKSSMGKIDATYIDKNTEGTVGSLQQSVKRHMEHAKHYLVLNGVALLDSQARNYQGQIKSVVSTYRIGGGNHSRNIHLYVSNIGDRQEYGDVPVVKPEIVPRLIRFRKTQFAEKPENVTLLGKINNLEINREATEKLDLVVESAQKIEPLIGPRENEWVKFGRSVLYSTPKFRTINPKSEILSAKTEFIPLPNYELKNLEKEFVIAKFERPMDSDHVYKILKSIVHNEFYDILMRVVKSEIPKMPDVKWGLVDFQHRFEALRLARDIYDLERYNLMLMLYPPEYDPRKVYTKVNLGKPLTHKDHSKAWDDGTIPFFNNLRDFLSHHPKNRNEISFIEGLIMHYYAQTSEPFAPKMRLENFSRNIKEEEVEKMKKFLISTAKVFGIKCDRNHCYMAPVFRNAYRVYYENNLDDAILTDFLENVKNDEMLKEVPKMKIYAKEYEQIYSKIKSLLPRKS